MMRSVGKKLGRFGPLTLAGLVAIACDSGGGGGGTQDDVDARGGGEMFPDMGDSTSSGIDGSLRDAEPPPRDAGPVPDDRPAVPDAALPDDAAPPPIDGLKPTPDVAIITPDAAMPCEPGTTRACADAPCPGTEQACLDGIWTDCEPPVEVCDGQDNDCNGTVDDDFEVDVPCFAGTGACEVDGVTVCGADRLSVVCGATPAAPGAETCNDIDDDCDGVADGAPEEGALTQSCYEGPPETLGFGVCSAGLSVCVAGVQGQCADQVLPGVETCNGLDDDCDGLTDEAEDGQPLQETCYSGPPGSEALGLCRAGLHVCGAGGVFGPCQGEVVPGFEICDQADNDCNGAPDDVAGGCACEPGQSRNCYSGPPATEGVGPCMAGRQTCVADGSTFGSCEGQRLPANETCDGLDNDCDGTADGDIAGTGAPCAAGLGACLQIGVTLCDPAAAAVVCDAVAGQASAELCDHIDNDCNGRVDDGLGLGDPCTGGIGACAAPGVLGCGDVGEVSCLAPQSPPSDEVCDGLDNDCNGADDDGFRVGEACTSGLGECAAGGFFACTLEGGVECTGVPGDPGEEVCDGLDNDCDGFVDNGDPGGGADCNFELPGNCAAGVTTCAGGAQTCRQIVFAQPETCDGTDEDCDGTIDNGPGGLVISQNCYTGPAGTEGVGICQGGSSLCAGGAFGACMGEILPGREICDSRDNDCSGGVDDVPVGACACQPGERRACFSGPAGTQNVGLCRGGTQICADDGLSFLPCEGEIVPAGEFCDGLDNNCNGRVDDAIPGVGAACSAGVGDCTARGVTFCDANSGEISCGAQPGVPRPEVCDAHDNDCNGNVDDGLSLGAACTVGIGTCAARGVLACAANGGVACSAQAGRPTAEVCDNLDNDCDGQIDDGLSLGAACNVGVGACRRAGALVCGVAGAVTCDAVPGAAQAELCDAIDNNCDGRVDENNPGGGGACNTGLLGVCGAGTQLCAAGALACQGRAQATAELCDGADNDCDGTADEDDEGGPLTRGCYEGPAGTNGVGVCHGGFATCGGGRYGACVGQLTPAPEICDTADNNCDGAVDNLAGGAICACIPGQVRNCYTGPAGTQNVGLCHGGTQTCNGDGRSFGACLGEVGPGGEICDAQDNDCNGAVDDAPGAGQPCSNGVGLCSRDGVRVCDPARGALTCNAVPGNAAVEICDGLDNDCDGVNDDVATLGNRCENGVGDCVRAGNVVCDLARRALTCNAVAGDPAAEVCDGNDNDCSGVADDGPLEGVGADCSVGVGACVAGGVTICGGVVGVLCDAAPGAPEPELCDGVDNDCDGLTDNAAQGTAVACHNGVGACQRAGLVQCVGAELACDAVPGAPVAEICDGVDNNCDEQVDNGLNCTIYSSCLDAYTRGQRQNGVYRIRPPGLAAPVDLYCDMVTDHGGWSLVASTVGSTLNDDGSSAWYADLATLAPRSAHATVWESLRTLGDRFDVRFACRDAVGAANDPMTVDLSFYRVGWYKELFGTSDATMCFNEADGAFQDMAPPARRNNLTGAELPRGDQWNFGYFEGEDACGDAGDFTVDFDDRGMGNNRSDGTDWGEDDNLRKCGRSGLATGQWFIFARERRRVAVLGPDVAAVLQGAGVPAETLSYLDPDVTAQLDTRTYEALVLGRYAQDWTRMSPDLAQAIYDFAADGGSLITEADGAALLMSGYDGSFAYAEGAEPPMGIFPGNGGGGVGPGDDTPVTLTVPTDPLFTGVPNPLHAGIGTADFLYAHSVEGENTYLRTVATFPGDGEVLPQGALPAIQRGRFCGGSIVTANFNYADNLADPGVAALMSNLGKDALLPPYPALEEQCPLPLREDLMLCGASPRNINEFLRGGTFLNVVAGCQPDDFTQAMLITRTAVAQPGAFDAAALQAYVRGGGLVLTEYGSSDEVFNAVFGANVPSGAQVGDCRNAVAPLIQYNVVDTFWDENRHSPPLANRRGCGFDLQGYPSITRLGGPNGQSVTLAYRDLGKGRVWLVEADWSSNLVGDVSMDPSRGLMHYMITHVPNPYDLGRLPVAQ